MTTGVFGGTTPNRVAPLALAGAAVVLKPAFPALGTTDVDAVVSFVRGGFCVGGWSSRETH